jgi:MraZ protein
MLLTGTFSRSIDQKLRVAIPKSLRDVLGSTEAFYVAPGTDESLLIYPEEAFTKLGRRLAHYPPTQQEVRDFTRLFYAQARRTELDRQGRIRIPPELAKLAEFGKNVVLLGVQDHLELWAEDRWQSYLADKRSRYDQIAEAAFRGAVRESDEQ